MITRQETMQSQAETQHKKQSKFSAWRGLFRVLDKLSLKKQLTRFFIFHPPKPTYNFVTSGLQDPGSDPVWEFKASNMGKLSSNPYIKPNAYKLYREKGDKTYMTPLIWLFNERSKSDYVVLYSHGNSSDLGTAYSSAVTFAIVFNMSVIAYDYTGYGLAPHKPSEKNLYDDIESVLSFIVTFLDYPLNKVILCGFSLGSGPTVEMAARYKSIPFMILLAPLASCLAMVEAEGLTEKSSHDMFANLDKIPDVACDIIFVHGLNDSVIPSHHSSKMFQRYVETHSAPKNNVWLLEVEDTDHHQLVQELADPKTEFRGLFMHYFDFLLENNHTIYNEREAKLGMEWENEMRNTIEKVRRKTNVTTSADGIEEHKASFKETGLINRVLFTGDVTNDFENEEKEGCEEKEEEEAEEKKEQQQSVVEATRLDLRSMTQSCFKRTVISEETLKLRNVFKNVTVNKPATKRKNSRKMYEEQLKSIKVFL